jgi:TrmH family RNA methyltransferase
MEVRRDDGGQGDELTPDDVFCVAIEETLSARRDHHRVEHVVGQPMLTDHLGHGLHHSRVREHAGLDRVRPKVRGHGPDLGADHLLGDGVHGGHLKRVLRSHCSERATAENAKRMERLEVGLDAGSTPAVATGDCEGYGRWVIHGVHTLTGMRMLSKSRRQLIKRLNTRKGRPREGLVLVEGVCSAAEALAAGADIHFWVQSPRSLGTEAGRALASTLIAQGLDAEEVDDSDLGELSATEHPQGILCVCTEPGLDLGQLGDREPSRLLLLDGLQDPGNLGTLIRAARAFGVDAVIVLDGSVDPWNPKAVRAAAGAGFHTPIARAPWAEAKPWLEEHGIGILAADPAGDDVRLFHPGDSWALAVGNEGVGLRAEIASASSKSIAIPMPGNAESLNAGVAGSILLYSLLTSVS